MPTRAKVQKSQPRGKSLAETPYHVQFKKSTLPNGVRIVTEKHPHARGVAVGFWVMVGTRDEAPKLAGVSHFVEHLVFKRTENRNAFEIARDMEAVGGELNAFTSREYTCFYTQSLKEHLGLSIDVLSDLVARAIFEKKDYEKEKQVVLQEIHMSEDNLEDLIYDQYFEKVFGKHALGRPILGTVDSIGSLKRKDVESYYKKHYTGPNVVVSVAGNVDHDEVVRLVSEKLGAFGGKKRAQPVLLHENSKRDRPKIHSFEDYTEKPSEQVHILLGLPAADFRDPLRFEGYIFNALVGGGMTSRLYQKVREEKGLAYSVYSQLSSFCDAGTVTVYAGTEAKHVAPLVKIILRELADLAKNGVTEKDLELFKTQILGQILLGADDIENRMNSIGVNEMVFGRYRSVDEVLGEINNVSLKSVHEYVEQFLDFKKLSLSLMGSYNDKKAVEVFGALDSYR